MPELWELDLWALREALRCGETCSEAIVQALIERRRQVDGLVNAWAEHLGEQALRRAREADRARARGEHWGPLHGLPVSVKENLDVQGLDTTLGIPAWRGRPARRDAVVVRLLRQTGAIVLGKTNVPQTLLLPMETVNPIWGRTRNPWNPERSSGGSSGGEAAALASGQSPAGIGTDIGGSIRIPAAYCGVAGLKPTVDRWSNLGSRTAIAGQEVVRAQTGPMARSVRDLVLLMQALPAEQQARHDPRVPPLPAPEPDRIRPEALRIGVYEDDGLLRPAEAMRRAVREAARALREAGAEVVPYEPPHAEEIVYLYFAALSSDGGAAVERALGGGPVVEELSLLRRIVHMPRGVRRAAAAVLDRMGERRLARLLRVLGAKPVSELWRLTDRARRLRVEELARWRAERIDAVLCPVHVTPACPHGASRDFTIGFCYVARWNLLDFPAGSVPWGRVRPEETQRSRIADRIERRAASIEAASAGLPTAVQVVASPWREDVALRVMGLLEQAARSRPDFPRTPVAPASGR